MSNFTFFSPVYSVDACATDKGLIKVGGGGGGGVVMENVLLFHLITFVNCWFCSKGLH